MDKNVFSNISSVFNNFQYLNTINTNEKLFYEIALSRPLFNNEYMLFMKKEVLIKATEKAVTRFVK